MERVDESAFQKPNVFQVVSKGYDEALQILYLAAQVNYTIVTSETHAIMQTVRILRGKKKPRLPRQLVWYTSATQRLLLNPQARASPQATKKVDNFLLCLQDVNEMNQWLSAIRKTTISNTNLLNYFHPGVFHKNKWTCCKRVIQSGQWIQSRVL